MSALFFCAIMVVAGLAGGKLAWGDGNAISEENLIVPFGAHPLVIAQHQWSSFSGPDWDVSMEEPLLILAPLSEKQTKNANPDIVKDSEPYVVRRGQVVFDVDQLLPWSADTSCREVTGESFQHRILRLAPFHGRSFELIVIGESHPEPAVVNLSLRLLGSELATGSVTVTRESFIMTIHDLGTATLYRIIGNTDTGIGEATQIDLLSLPPRYDSTPQVLGGR